MLSQNILTTVTPPQIFIGLIHVLAATHFTESCRNKRVSRGWGLLWIWCLITVAQSTGGWMMYLLPTGLTLPASSHPPLIGAPRCAIRTQPPAILGNLLMIGSCQPCQI